MSILIALEKCIFSHPGHQNGGDPCFVIGEDGSRGYCCFHPDCANKTIQAVE